MARLLDDSARRVPTVATAHLRHQMVKCQTSRRDPPASIAANALDFYGPGNSSTGCVDAAFYGKNREYALGNTPQQRFMGMWSDGVPVKELKSPTTLKSYLNLGCAGCVVNDNGAVRQCQSLDFRRAKR